MALKQIIVALLAIAVAIFALQYQPGSIAELGPRNTTGVAETPAPPQNGAAPAANGRGGTLDYGFCCCSADDVDANTEALLMNLNDITVHPYFRYFKVNTEKDCPFWAVSLVCNSEDNACTVGKCTQESIPRTLWSNKDMSDLSTPDSHISQMVPHPYNADDWGLWLSTDDAASYVDLVANPEGNTGFSGPMAIKVWQAIYKENCLSTTDETCQEVDVLRTLLSGLHMSINLQVATNFKKDPNLASPQHTAGIYNNPLISFFPNCEMFEKRIAPNRQFIDNLYILYQFTLRALTKSKAQFIRDLDSFNAGEGGVETPEDAKLKKSIADLFNSKLLCVKTFDETRFLESPKGLELLPQMKRMLTNVTHLMDCVPCEKCRIWGKLETKGMATALKVNMSPGKTPVILDRAEQVTLINLTRQLAFAVRNVKRLTEYCPTEKRDQ